MKYSEIKNELKKDPPSDFYVFLHRKLGLFLTWITINTFPSISPNLITISMLPMNIVSFILLYNGILHSSVPNIISSFLIFILSGSIDCVDGNIARLQKRTSTLGVVLDRFVHNVSHPLLFISCGLSISTFSHFPKVTLVIFFLAAMYSEFPPHEIATKQVLYSFINQYVFKKSQNFVIKNHIEKGKKKKFEISTNRKGKNYSTILYLIRAIFAFENFFIVILLDVVVLESKEFIISKIFISIYLIAKIIKDVIFRDNIDRYLEKFMELK